MCCENVRTFQTLRFSQIVGIHTRNPARGKESGYSGKQQGPDAATLPSRGGPSRANIGKSELQQSVNTVEKRNHQKHSEHNVVKYIRANLRAFLRVKRKSTSQDIPPTIRKCQTSYNLSPDRGCAIPCCLNTREVVQNALQFIWRRSPLLFLFERKYLDLITKLPQQWSWRQIGRAHV